MTPLSAQGRVRRAGRILQNAAVTSSALRGVASALVVLLVAAFVDATVALPVPARRVVPVLALVAGTLILARRLRRTGALRASETSAALWVESRFPVLRYALVTAVDPAFAGRVPELDRQVALVPFEPEVRRVAQRAVARPALAALVGAALIWALPSGVVTRVIRPREGDALERVAPRFRANPLATIVVHITPPAYAGLPVTSVDNPASVRALVGSAIVIEGRAEGDPISAFLGDQPAPASRARDRWNVSLSVPPAPLAVRLRAGSRERLLVLEPIVDSIPVVTITLPARDSIYRRPSGSVRLAADASDDLALASGTFEYIVSSGSGENFTFKSGTLGTRTFTDRTGVLSASLSLDGLDLNPGDIVHLRAVARDRNTVSGPGLGASETRTLRIARADEYDSVAVDGAPPPEPEKNALSQRMILMLTEALQKKRPTISRGALVSESRGIAVEQARLRKRVGQTVFTRLGEAEAEEGDALEKRLDHPVNADSLLAAAERATTTEAGAALEGNADETPLVAINRPLLEAFNFMWSAGTELEIGEPGKAIPWMKKALDALQAARAAERIYLRGRTRPVVVDIERVRLSGKEKGAPDQRSARPAADPARLQRLARFDVALGLVNGNPAAAADTLLLLRLTLLDQDATAVRALEAAANALRGDRKAGDATIALSRARAALAGVAPRRGALSTWGAGR